MLRRRFVFFIAFLILLPQMILAETISVSNQTAQPGDTVEVAISLDTPANTLGAVFTVHYATDYLTLNQVASPFFRTFAQQWAGSPGVPPQPPSQVRIEGVTYVQPFVVNPVAGGVMLAGVNIEKGNTEKNLFILEFEVSATIPDGIYPVSVSTSFITHEAAGYPEEGLGLPLLYPEENTSVISGRISIHADIIDSDGDGIDDAWEIRYFGNLLRASSTSDFDNDGYTDLQEYLNQVSGTLDGSGNSFNPKKKNDNGGVGFVPFIKNSTILKMIIPMILENSKRLRE